MTAALAPAIELPRPGTRVSVRPAPRREPPFDDEREALATVTPLDRHLPFDLARRRPAVWQPPQSRPAGLAEPGAWSRRLLIGLIETAGGKRPLQQLCPFLSPSVHRGINGQFDRAAIAGRPHWLRAATVRSVHACEPADDVAELCAVLDTGQRVRAVAMRIEHWRGHWRCTRLQLG